MITEKQRFKRSNVFYNFLFISTAILVLIGDFISKQLVLRTIDPYESITIIPGLLYITNVRNSGAAFGIFQNMTDLFIIVSGIAAILIIILKIKIIIRSFFYNLGLGFILGGALGNLYDRIFVREVTDFIHVRYFAVFNVADSFIVIGFFIVVIVLFKAFFSTKDNKKEDGKENTGKRSG